MSVIPFPKSGRPTPQPKATAADILVDCCLELSGHLLDQERANAVYRVLNRLDASEMAMLAELLKELMKAAETECA